MKELLRSHSLSYVQEFKARLEAEGIKTILMDEQSLGFMGFAGRVRLMVARDPDFESAIRIVRELEALTPVPQIPPSWRVQRWGCAGLVVGFALLVAGAVLAQQEPRTLGYWLFAGAVALFAIGLALIMLGPRRDRTKEE